MTDVIRSGTTVLDTAVLTPFVVPANSSHDFVHTFTAPNGTTNLNDIATATYTDQATGIPVPGTTTATASTTVQPTNVISNNSATVSDVESITGAGLSYRVDSTTDSSGSFATGALPPAGVPYGVPVLPGPFTTSDVYWKSGTKTASGSVTFGKTIKFDGSVSSSGTLSDVATVTGSDGFTATSNASSWDHGDQCAKLTIKKVTDPASDPQDFDYDLTGGGVPADLGDPRHRCRRQHAAVGADLHALARSARRPHGVRDHGRRLVFDRPRLHRRGRGLLDERGDAHGDARHRFGRGRRVHVHEYEGRVAEGRQGDRPGV